MNPILTAITGLALLFLLSACASSRVYPMPFDQAEAALYESLRLDRDQVRTNPVRALAVAEGELAKPMSMTRYAVNPEIDVPGERLRLTLQHRYNIGATGAEYIRFDLQARGPDTTRVKVNYTDRWVGIWPPFIFYNPGMIRERRISKLIWGGE